MGTLHVLVDLDDSSQIAASVAVVWCREDCGHMVIVGMLESVIHQLVGSYDFLKSICVIEFH